MATSLVVVPLSFKSYPREGVSIFDKDISPELISFKSYPREGVSLRSLGIIRDFGVSSHTPVRAMSST